jgi:uncharacterized membrane protein YdjX (TVP38/TMEM64 family)
MNIPKQNNNKKLLNIIRGIILIFVVGLTIALLIKRDDIQRFQEYGYVGIFIFSLLANATILIPIPGILLTSAMGAVFNPAYVALVAGSGAALGELSGYLAGFSGQALVENSEKYQKILGWMKKYGDITILVLAFIPNPLFDLAGVIAGILKMPLWKFILFCLIGKVLKMLVFAYLGLGLFSYFA